MAQTLRINMGDLHMENGVKKKRRTATGMAAMIARVQGERWIEQGDSRGEWRTRFFVDIPLEFGGKVAGAGAVAEASDVERRAASRHGACGCRVEIQRLGDSGLAGGSLSRAWCGRERR